MNVKSFVTVITCILCVFLVVSFSFAETVHAAGDYSYEYKFKKGKWKEKGTGWIDAGGQAAGGVRFASGIGGFYWSDKGGPSGSVTFGATYGFASFSVSVNMGTEAPRGKWTAVPGKPKDVKKHFYKLKVKKNIKARPIRMYRRLKNSNKKWEFVSQSVQYKVTSYELGIRQVK